MHPSEILTYSVGNQCFLKSRGVLPALALSFLLWVLLHDDPLCPHQDYNPRFTPPVLDILRGLPSGPSCEAPPTSPAPQRNLCLLELCLSAHAGLSGKMLEFTEQLKGWKGIATRNKNFLKNRQTEIK